MSAVLSYPLRAWIGLAQRWRDANQRRHAVPMMLRDDQIGQVDAPRRPDAYADTAEFDVAVELLRQGVDDPLLQQRGRAGRHRTHDRRKGDECGHAGQRARQPDPAPTPVDECGRRHRIDDTFRSPPAQLPGR